MWVRFLQVQKRKYIKINNLNNRMETIMQLQQVLSKVRQAIDMYHMIEANDKIAIGISGGKDSLTLLYAMAELQKFYPIPFELVAATVDLGFDNIDFRKIHELCATLNIPYHIIKTDIANIVFEERKESNPCALCAKMRKGAINNAMLEIGCNKIAYAHHKDDVVETYLLSLLYEGRMHTFQPVTKLDKTGLTVIRPLVYMNESDVKGFVNKENLPVVKSPCPADGHTKREYSKKLLQTLNQDNPGVKNRIFKAIQESNICGW